jgi:hypothetical protein
VLSLPKLNLQFLTLYDLFHRCFTLYRLESAVGIRADIVEAVSRGQLVLTFPLDVSPCNSF